MPRGSSPLKYSAMIPVELGFSAEPDQVLDYVRQVEALGYESVVAVEHAVVIGATESAYPYSPDGRLPLPDTLPYPDPLELLAFLAAGTERIGLATGVLVAPNHNPVVLAKRLATLDRLSRGRLRICLGLGWMREEIEACGGDFARRGKIADESIRLMRELWAGTGEEGVSFDGDFFQVARAHSYPKPHHAGAGVPLHIGGHSRAAARRAGRLGDGFQPLGLAGDDLTAAIDEMRRAEADAGRAPGSVQLTLGATAPRAAEKTEWARSLGAERLLLSGSRKAVGKDELLSELAATAEQLGLTR